MKTSVFSGLRAHDFKEKIWSVCVCIFKLEESNFDKS